MAYSFEGKLVIALSPAALFSFDSAAGSYLPGTAYPFIKALHQLSFEGESPLEILLLCREDGRRSIELFKAAEDFGLNIVRAAFIGNGDIAAYLEALGADLLLSDNEEDVQAVINAGLAAALVAPADKLNIKADFQPESLGIAFDADAVIFSDPSLINLPSFQAFSDHEREMAHIPLPPGPFAVFLQKLCLIKKQLKAESIPLRCALVTSRSAPSHERVIRSLESMGVTMDEVFFLGGLEKAPILKVLKSQMYFDDMKLHIDAASAFVPSARVLYKEEKPTCQ